MGFMSLIRILLVDDNNDFLDGVTAWLEGRTAFELVGKSRSGQEALDQIDLLSPDLVLMDVAMSGMNGFECTRRIRSRQGAPAVILLTFHESHAARLEAWSAGAEGLIDKARVTEQLPTLVRQLFPKQAASGLGRGETIKASLASKPGPARDLEG